MSYYRPGPFADSSYNWSPDSKWLVYTLFSGAQIESGHLYSIEQARSFPLTDGMSDVSEPVFDPAGKHLYLFASTDAGPVRDWFSQASADMQATRAIYLVVLAKGEPSPLAPESDEEKPAAPGTAKAADAAEADKDEEKAPAPAPTRIDIDGIATRIVALPVPAADFRSLQVSQAGKLHYLRTAADETTLQLFDMEKRKSETLLTGLDDYVPSADGKKLAYRNGEQFAIGEAANLRKVTEATDGRVAYVYVPNTADLGHEYFKRYFFPQTNRDAVIIDERFNGGGQVADYYIDLLRRPLVSYWATRHGAPIRTPSATIPGPKVMITDETAGSGGDLLPWMFRASSTSVPSSASARGAASSGFWAIRC